MFLVDLVRYLLWRIATRHERVRGSVLSANAHIHYQRIGAGPVVVLLHGGLSSSVDWYLLLPKLSRVFSLVLIDFRGHGRSTIDLRELDYELYGRDVIAVLDALSITHCGVIGWSDGGNVGLWIAHRYPDRVSQLIAISANIHPDGLLDSARASIDKLQSSRFPSLSRVLHALRSSEGIRPWSALKSRVIRLWTKESTMALAQLTAINAKTLLVIGSNDDIRLSHAQAMARAIPSAKLTVLPDIRHNVPIAARRQLFVLITEFMRVDRSPSSLDR